MAYIIRGIPFISQLGTYPTGCESVSCTMALQHLGWTGTVDDFIKLLPKSPPPRRLPNGTMIGPDPRYFFPGDPYSTDGWGCFAPCLEEVIRKIGGFSTTTFYGRSLEDLKPILDAGHPLVFWGTINFKEPQKTARWRTGSGDIIQWISPMHCTLLIGYDDDGFYFNDPTGGKDAYYSYEEVRQGYEAQGSIAMLIQKDR